LYIIPRLFELDVPGFEGPEEEDSDYESADEDDN
jgi:hypothetical protein